MAEISRNTIVLFIGKALQQLQSSDSQLTELQLPKDVFERAYELVGTAVFGSRYFEQGYFNHIFLLAKDVTLARAVDEVKGWQEGLKAVIRYPLNLLLSPNRPELNRVKLSTPHYVYRVEKKIKNALNILHIMGYSEIRGTSDLALRKNTQEHLLQTVADLTVLHEELSLVLFLLDRVTKLRKEDGSLATLSEIFTARRNGPPNRMATLDLVMTGYESPKPISNNRHDIQYSANAYNKSQHGMKNPSPYTPNSYGQTQYNTSNTYNQSHYGASQSQYGASQSQYGASQSQYGASQSQYGASQSQYGASQSQYGASQSQYGASQSQYGASQSQYEASRSQNEVSRSQYGAGNAVGPPLYPQTSTQPGYGRPSEVCTDRIPSSTSKGVPSNASNYGGPASPYPATGQTSYDSPSYSPSDSPRRYPSPSQSKHPQNPGHSQLSNQYREPPRSVMARSPSDPSPPITSTPLTSQKSRDSWSPLPEDLPPPIFDDVNQLAQMFKDKDYPSLSMGDRSPTESIMPSKLEHIEQSPNSSIPPEYSFDRRTSSSSSVSSRGQSSFTKQLYQPFAPSTKPSFTITGSIDEDEQNVESTPRSFTYPPTSGIMKNNSHSVGSGLSHMDHQSKYDDRGYHDDSAIRFDGAHKPDNKPAGKNHYYNLPVLPERQGSDTYLGSSGELQQYQKMPPRRKSSNDVLQRTQCPDWPHTRGGEDWPHTRGGEDWPHTWGGETTRQQIRNYSKERPPDHWEDGRPREHYTQSGAAARPSYNTSQPPSRHYGSSVPVTSYNRPPQNTYQTYMEERRHTVQTDEPSTRWKCKFCMQMNPQNVSKCVVCKQSLQHY